MKFGLKLWSTNDNYKKEAIRLYEQGIYHYIELYAVPGTYDTYIDLWKDIDIPFVIHAPHFREGLNLAKKENRYNNMLLVSETRKFADALKADKIIVHPGTAGEIEETVRQLKELDDPRIMVENKPYYALDDGLICNGATVEEIKFVLDNANVGFCLDIGHAICSANAKKMEPFKYLREFIKLNPAIYHLTDGDYKSVYDRHDHFGKGNYDIKAILNILPENCFMTIETIKNSNENLVDFEEDIWWLINLNNGYKIRTANEDDMLDVFNLSNDPIVRQNSFNQEIISLDRHVEWFNDKINNGNCIFYIIRSSDDELIGYSRFDRIAGTDDFILTIHLSSRFRGQGYGRKIIKQTSNMILNGNKSAKIIAYVKESNQISLKSFMNAGYEIIGSENISDSFCYKLKFSAK